MNNRNKRIIGNALTVAIPVVAVGACIIMGLKAKTVENVYDVSNTNNITQTSYNLITNTSILNSAVITTTTTTKTNYLEAVSLGYDMESDVTEETNTYYNWDMYGNWLPTEDPETYAYMDTTLLSYIFNECETYGVPFEFALATCYVESGFQADVDNEGLNTDGSIDYGIMGLNGNYLMDNCIAYNGGVPINPYNAYENVHIGIQILAEHLNYYGGSIWDAANAYNLGIGGWNDMNYWYGYWYYGDKILNYINILNNSTVDNWGVD